MNLLTQCNKHLKRQPADFSYLSGSATELAFSQSVEQLNHHPNAGLMGYDMYIRKNRLGLWSTRKAIYMEYYDGLCQVCKLRKAVTLHHQSYAHLGKEEIAGEVVLICSKCHSRAHQKEIEYASQHRKT